MAQPFAVPPAMTEATPAVAFCADAGPMTENINNQAKTGVHAVLLSSADPGRFVDFLCLAGLFMYFLANDLLGDFRQISHQSGT